MGQMGHLDPFLKSLEFNKKAKRDSFSSFSGDKYMQHACTNSSPFYSCYFSLLYKCIQSLANSIVELFTKVSCPMR